MTVPASNGEETLVCGSLTGGLAELHIRHPPGTFALTPASLIGLRTVGEHRHQLAGIGLDWGSGTGCLAIAAAKLSAVDHVTGLEIEPANVAVAGENAALNGVSGKVRFLLSDSYSPVVADDRAALDALIGRVNFLLANPPSSEGDDGFGFRRVVLRGAPRYLANGAVVFLNVSSQYGQQRVERLCGEAPGFTYGGVLCTTDWVAFDLGRPDLLHALEVYVAEETRGGLSYSFRHPSSVEGRPMDARAAFAHFKATGQSPLSQWQTHLFHFGRSRSPSEP